MKKSQSIALVSLAAVLAMGLAGCTKKDNRTVISVWTTFNTTYQAIIEKAIKNFDAQYGKEYKIEYTKQNGSYNDLKDMVVKGVAAGAYPDVTVAYPDSVADFLMTGKALNIQPYMENPEYGWTKEDFDDIATAYIEDGQNYMIPGTYSLPICKSTEAMYYNRGALIDLDLSSIDDEINDGNPLDDEYLQSLTWEEMFDHLCPAIIEYNNNQDDEHKLIKPSGDYVESWAVLGYDSDDNLFITLAEQYGYDYTTLDKATGIGSPTFVNDGMKNLMKKFNKAYVNHYFTTKGIVGKNVNYLTTTDNMLFAIGSTGGVSYQFSASNPKDVGVAPIPQAAGRDSKVINQGPSVAFMKRGATKEETEKYAKGAWLFYKEWTTTEIGVEWATTTGYSPIRTSVMNSNDYLAYSNTSNKTAKTLDMLTARNARYATSVLDDLFTSPVFSGSSSARNAVAGLAADCIGNKNKGLITDDQLNTYFQTAYNNAL